MKGTQRLYLDTTAGTDVEGWAVIGKSAFHITGVLSYERDGEPVLVCDYQAISWERWRQVKAHLSPGRQL